MLTFWCVLERKERLFAATILEPLGSLHNILSGGLPLAWQNRFVSKDSLTVRFLLYLRILGGSVQDDKMVINNDSWSASKFGSNENEILAVVKSSSSSSSSSSHLVKDESLHTNQVIHQARAYLGFCSTKWLGVCLPQLDGMLVFRRVPPSIKFASTYLWPRLVEKGTVRVNCLAQENNVMSSARDWTRTGRSGD